MSSDATTAPPGSTPAPPLAIDLQERFSRFDDQWSPQRIATLNDYDVRLAKIEGEFVWHAHPDTDELFLVVAGDVRIQLRLDGHETTVELGPGQLFVVPKGVEHCPVANAEAQILMIEPRDTPNTGDTGGDRTRTPQDLA